MTLSLSLPLSLSLSHAHAQTRFANLLFSIFSDKIKTSNIVGCSTSNCASTIAKDVLATKGYILCIKSYFTQQPRLKELPVFSVNKEMAETDTQKNVDDKTVKIIRKSDQVFEIFYDHSATMEDQNQMKVEEENISHSFIFHPRKNSSDETKMPIII